MADNYLQFSESLDSLAPEEADWLREQLGEDPLVHCPRFLLDLADRETDDTDYGFQHDFQGDLQDSHLWISAEERGDVERVAHLVQKFLRRFRPDQCWSLTYATTCSKLRLGEFGGGAVFVTTDDIHWNDSYDFVEEHQKAFERRQHDLRLIRKAEELGIRPERFDEAVHEAAAGVAASINNAGAGGSDHLSDRAVRCRTDREDPRRTAGRGESRRLRCLIIPKRFDTHPHEAQPMKTTLTLDIEYDSSMTDPEGLACAMDRLMEMALSTPGIMTEYGDPKMGEFFVAQAAEGCPKRGLTMEAAGIHDFGIGTRRRWVLYDLDTDCLLTTRTYDTYQDAADDASQLNDVLILPVVIQNICG
jgi:hypothetical protein